MIRVWLVRHGETQWNAEHRFQGVSDIALTDRGREQAAELALRIGDRSFDTVWSSDLIRAVETARIVFGEPTIDVRLRELDFGDIDGLRWSDLSDEVRESLLEFKDFVAPNGESVAAMYDRIAPFMDELAHGDHVVVTHGGVVRMVSELCGIPAFPGHCEVTVVNWTDRKVLSRDI
jgi:probable phosphoglycerate mutase